MLAKTICIIYFACMAIGIFGGLGYNIYAAVMRKKGKPYRKCLCPLFKEAEGYVYPKKMKEPEPFYDERFKEWCIDASVANVTDVYWAKTKEEVLSLYYKHETQTSTNNLKFDNRFTDSL